jgi:hypothetical protein
MLDIAYLEVGPRDGPTVILLYGFPYDGHAYDDVARHLEAAGQPCIIPFLRGYGPTQFRAAETPRSGQQAALAADLLALMDALEIQKAVLAGYDWGGRAAPGLEPTATTYAVCSGNCGHPTGSLAKRRMPAAPLHSTIRILWRW